MLRCLTTNGVKAKFPRFDNSTPVVLDLRLQEKKWEDLQIYDHSEPRDLVI